VLLLGLTKSSNELEVTEYSFCIHIIVRTPDSRPPTTAPNHFQLLFRVIIVTFI